jgi:proteic killer suppression protein
MEIAFRTERLRRDCTEAKWMQRRWGANRSGFIRRRLDQLHAAENLEQVRLVHRRTHELKGNREDLISLDLDGSWRLLIEPAEDPPPRKGDGGLDWSLITAVRVVVVEDTHD